MKPAFRVVFLTTGMERVNHVLWLARELAKNADRRLVYATTQDMYVSEQYAVTQPIVIDHHGRWQAMVNAQPSSNFLREPVQLTPPVASPRGL